MARINFTRPFDLLPVLAFRGNVHALHPRREHYKDEHFSTKGEHLTAVRLLARNQWMILVQHEFIGAGHSEYCA